MNMRTIRLFQPIEVVRFILSRPKILFQHLVDAFGATAPDLKPMEIARKALIRASLITATDCRRPVRRQSLRRPATGPSNRLPGGRAPIRTPRPIIPDFGSQRPGNDLTSFSVYRRSSTPSRGFDVSDKGPERPSGEHHLPRRRASRSPVGGTALLCRFSAGTCGPHPCRPISSLHFSTPEVDADRHPAAECLRCKLQS